MDISIREATEADLPQILYLYGDAGLDTHRTLSLEEAEVMFRKLGSYPYYKLYVALSGDIIVGTFALLIMDNLVNGGLPSGIVEDVAVASQWQGKGVGKQMMQFALDMCRQRGCYKMALSSNMIRVSAHTFYESLGFTRHGYSFRVEFQDAERENKSVHPEPRKPPAGS